MKYFKEDGQYTLGLQILVEDGKLVAYGTFNSPMENGILNTLLHKPEVPSILQEILDIWRDKQARNN